jgi:hypothetical protein
MKEFFSKATFFCMNCIQVLLMATLAWGVFLAALQITGTPVPDWLNPF